MLAVVFGITLLATMLLATTPVKTAEFLANDNNNTSGDLVITSKKKNLYTAGNNVVLESNIDEDFVAAGAKVTAVKNNIITGGVNIAAGTVELKVGRVAKTVRIFAQDVTISGSFDSDVMVFGNTLTIKNATIKGDLIFAGNELNIEKTSIGGAFQGSYKTYNGDKELKAIVKVKLNNGKTRV